LREGNLHWDYLGYGARPAISMPGDSRISKKHHESEVHVSLVVAMEQSRAGIVRCEIHVGSRVCRNHQHILFEPGNPRSIQTSDLERMPMQMERVIVRASIDHPQPIPPPLLEHDCVRMGIGLPVDRPGIEGALPVKL